MNTEAIIQNLEKLKEQIGYAIEALKANDLTIANAKIDLISEEACNIYNDLQNQLE